MSSKEEDYQNLVDASHIKGLVDQRTTYRDRMNICEECDSFRRLTRQCKECGCFMFLKARIAAMSCPLGKWEAVEPCQDCTSSWII